MIYLKKSMRSKFLALLILASCSVKQDFEKDIRVPVILKDYAKEQKEQNQKKSSK